MTKKDDFSMADGFIQFGNMLKLQSANVKAMQKMLKDLSEGKDIKLSPKPEWKKKPKK